MKYLYCFANASLTLRVIEYLHARRDIPLEFVTVIHLINSWIVKIKIKSSLNPQEDGDLRAFLNELGFSSEPSMSVNMALQYLEAGHSPIKVMRSYQVVVVSHGSPAPEEIQVFRQQFIKGLGYCPQHLA